MHPLEALNEQELSSLTRVADRLLHTHHLLAAGQRPDRLRAGSGIEFLDHREFSPGDDLRHIDWRSTARSRHPQVRRYADEAAADWFIALDCSASMTVGEGKKWVLALQCAAAMAYLLIHLGNRVSVLLFSNNIEQMIPLGRGYTHYARILQALRRSIADASGGGSNLRSCLRYIKKDSPVFVISDFLTADHMQDGLDALTLRGDRLHALQITSSRDFLVPGGTRASLRDVESGQTITVDTGKSAQQDYQIAVNNYFDSVADYFRKQRIHYSRHTDNESWKPVLVAHLRARNR